MLSNFETRISFIFIMLHCATDYVSPTGFPMGGGPIVISSFFVVFLNT